jgi:membrane protease YdiL (CAAX protease family)
MIPSSSNIISILLILVTSALLIITGLKKRPGIGILGAIIIISITLWIRGHNLNAIGFSLPSNWGTTILLGLIFGCVIYLLSAVFIDPLSEKFTKTTHDHSAFNNIKGNWKAYIQMLVMVWIFVATIEEGLYRGFLMTEASNIIGTNLAATILNVIFTSIVFGFSHGYQNRCGMLSTGIIGALFGCVFVICGFNVWVALFAHGFLDTIALGLIAIDKEKYIQQKIWMRA